MSLYNMVNGFNPAVALILPMIGEKPGDFPRFRDCFTQDEDHPEYDNFIQVYTRTGGNNREGYADQIADVRKNPYYVDDYDDSFDSTYMTFVFRLPDEWKADYDKLLNDDHKNTSPEYQAMVRAAYPGYQEAFDFLFEK